MKWLKGGWQRADRYDGATEVRTGAQRNQWSGQGTKVERAPFAKQQPAATSPAPVMLSPDARDVDVSAASFRTLLIGGGISGLLVVIFAASLVDNSGDGWLWFWQLVTAVIFGWFIVATRGALNGRGFLLDYSGFYARTKGEVVGIPWNELHSVGIGSKPWIQNKRPTHPQFRHALELYPADKRFPERHPEFTRWLVDHEPPPMAGLPPLRYRFTLPPFSRLPRELEESVRTVAPQLWMGRYRR